MTLSKHSNPWKFYPIHGDFTEAAAAETAEGVQGTANLAEALALETILPADGLLPLEGGMLEYNATAEGRTGEVAVNGNDLDEEPGLVYGGPAGVFNHLQVRITNLDVLEGTIAPEATDSVVAAVFVNNDIIAFADEGYTVEIDTATLVEFNIDTIVTVTEGDVVRFALVGGGEETADWDVSNTPGEWMIM